MRIDRRMKIQTRLGIWWGFIIYTCLSLWLIYLLACDCYKSNRELEFTDLICFIVSGIIWLSICTIIDMHRLLPIRQSLAALTEEQRQRLSEEWEVAERFCERGDEIGFVGEYVIAKRKSLFSKWYIIDIRQILKVKSENNSPTTQKLTIDHNNTSKLLRSITGEIVLNSMVGEYKNEDVELIKLLIQEKTGRNVTKKEFHISSKLFDDKGSYGGNQYIGDGMDLYKSYAAKKMIAEKHNRSLLTEDEYNTFIKRVNSEGCVYVSLCNSIMYFYENREEEFLKTFGFPLYNGRNGMNFDFNHEFLLLDIYSSMDNVDPKTGKRDYKRDFNSKADKRESYSYWNDDSGEGVYRGEAQYYLKTFMKEHGVRVEISDKLFVTPDNFEYYIMAGYFVLLSIGKCQWKDKYGKEGSVEGHTVSVTGTTEDGRFIFSSWGNKYFCEPSKLVESTFYAVKLIF